MTDHASQPRYAPPPWQHGNPVYTLSTRPDVKHDLGGGLRQFLASDERLLALVGISIAPGRRKIEAPPDERSPGRKAADRAADAASILLGGGNTPSLNKMLGTESVSAHRGSWAYRLLDTWHNDRGGLGCLLVSDQRLVLVSRRASSEAGRYEALLDIPREAVSDVRLAPKPLVRGRVVIGFTDGSAVALKYGTWRSGVARRLVDAVSQWRMRAGH